jgi:hypothetical protein
MGQQMAKTMWATLASFMVFFFFFWLSPLQSLGFNHTLKLRKKKKSDAPPDEALEANWLFFSFFLFSLVFCFIIIIFLHFFFWVIRLQQNKIKYKGKRSPPPEKLDRKMY